VWGKTFCHQVLKGGAAQILRVQQTCIVTATEILQGHNTKKKQKRKISSQGKKIGIGPYMSEKDRESNCKHACPFFGWKPCYCFFVNQAFINCVRPLQNIERPVDLLIYSYARQEITWGNEGRYLHILNLGNRMRLIVLGSGRFNSEGRAPGPHE